MPREDRRIIFESEEIYKALFAFCAQKQIKKPPPGQVIKITNDEGNENNFIVTFGNPLDPSIPNKDYDYSRDFLAAALMLYCRGLGIPLPKSASKSVLVRDGQAILRVQI